MANGDDTAAVDQTPATNPANVTADVMGGLVSAEGLATQGLSQPIQTVSPDLTSTIPTVPQPVYNRVDDQHLHGLRGILDKVATIMGGGETYHVTKDDQGNVSIDKSPATTGEKWGRIAAAALSGAAAGMGQQGINAPARSVGAGFQVGQQVADAGRTQAEQEAQMQQQVMLRNAQRAKLHQDIIGQEFINTNAPQELQRKQQAEDMQTREWILEHGGRDEGIVTNHQDILDAATRNPALVDHHMGQGGSILYQVPLFGQGVHNYTLPQSAAATRLTEPRPYSDRYFVDPQNPSGPLLSEPTGTAPVGTKLDDFFTKNMAVHDANGKAAVARQQMIDKENAPAGTAGQLMYAPGPDGKPTAYWATPPRGGQPATYTPAMPGMTRKAPDEEPTVGDDSLQGEDYLQSLPAPMRAQVQAIARGDAPLPSMGRNPANRVIRDAVFNYDPTYRTQRYDTMQNFRTKGDSTALTQMSTALEHADNALANSAKVGGTWINPSLALGTRAQTDDEAAYQKDADFLVGETGRLVTGGVIGVQEGDKLTNGLMSSRQSVRDSAINEILRLTKGKVDALYEKFRRGAGTDLPTEEFLGPDSIARLQKYNMALPTGNTLPVGGNTPTVRSTPTPPAPPAAAPTAPNRPANVPPNYVYRQGSQGLGWYRPGAQ